MSDRQSIDDAFFVLEEHPPEQRLFRAIIGLAALDAAGRNYFQSADERHRARRSARRWFVDAGDDYQFVCSLAGVCPAATRTAVLRFIGESVEAQNARLAGLKVGARRPAKPPKPNDRRRAA